MRTTLDLNDELVTKAKLAAARQHTTLTRLIEEGLQLRLRDQPSRSSPARLPIYRGKGGLIAGIDSTSNKSMLEAADDDA